MKKVASLILSVALASSAFAGPVAYSAKTAKDTIVPPLAPVGCNCFAPGAAFGVFGGGLYESGQSIGDGSVGGGVLGEYFFTENFGIQGSYGVFSTNSAHHEFDASLVFRMPIKSICVAPYLMAGGGYATNSFNAGNYFIGAGIEARISSAHCLGIFIDGTYHWSTSSCQEDYTIIRVGVKYPF